MEYFGRRAQAVESGGAKIEFAVGTSVLVYRSSSGEY